METIRVDCLKSSLKFGYEIMFLFGKFTLFSSIEIIFICNSLLLLHHVISFPQGVCYS